MKTKYALFCLMALLLGAIGGSIVWIILKIIAVLTELIWLVIPSSIFGGSAEILSGQHSIFYNLVVCLIGGVLIGLFQRKNGILPEHSEQVFETIKEEGGYPYDRLLVVSVAVIMPLIFGGALGPEAGLIGIIAGLCCWFSDSLKRRGHTLIDDEGKETLAETGVALTLGVIFGAPLFGIVGNIEPDNKSEKYKEKILGKKGRIFIYCMGVAGALLAMKGLGALLSLMGIELGGGLPRFERMRGNWLDQWKYFIPLFIGAIILAAMYKLFNLVTDKLAAKIAEHRVISCIIPGLAVAIIGYYFPYTLFSGEHQLGELMEEYAVISVSVLLLSAILKMLLVNICISFGWRGGSIFPIIFSTVSAGYALAAIMGTDPCFAAAVMAAACYAFINKKPATTVAIMMLCFPVTYLPALIVAAVLAAKIPTRA